MNTEKQPQKLSELTFQLVVESSPSAIVLVNKEGKIVYVNSQCEKLFGYVRTELIGQLVEILIPKRYEAKHPNFRKHFFKEPTVRAMGAGRELFAQRKNGTEFPIEIGLNPIVTVDGTLVLASIIDITERKSAELRFKQVVNSAPNAMILVDASGVINLVNDEVVNLFGYERVELIGQQLEQLIPERYRKNHHNYRDHFFSNPQTRSMGVGRDLFGLRKDGSEVPIEIGLNPIETEEGQMVLASIINISERKLREAAAKKQAELEVRNHELEQFTYIGSHDLQEPLRTLSNYAQIFEEDFGDQLDDTAKLYLNTIKQASIRMRDLVKALLDYARLGRVSTLVHADINQIVKVTLTDLSSTIVTTGAKIELTDSLPSLYVYETEMRQLFMNLINNAIKFRKKGVSPEIMIGCKQLKDKWQFSIKDNGIGIDQKHFDRIFQIFQRLHKVDEYEGYGVGLPNCKKIVDLHKGELWVESELGKGSAFYFTISNLKS